LAAEVEGVLAGYAFVRVISGALAVSWEFSDPHAELATLSIGPGYRGRGIGAVLMDVVHTELRKLGIADMAIGVITTNERAAPSFTSALARCRF
jgi:ribosomal protein S18 acetylase RimI-like enzyme